MTITINDDHDELIRHGSYEQGACADLSKKHMMNMIVINMTPQTLHNSCDVHDAARCSYITISARYTT